MSIGRILRSALNIFGRSRRRPVRSRRRDPKAAAAQQAVREVGKRL